MSDKPTIKFEIGTPKNIKLGKFFKEGVNRVGPWYGYNAWENGVESVLFADAALQQHISAFSAGDTIIICERREGKSRYWEVNQAVVDHAGRIAPPPQAKLTDPKALADYRAQRRKDLAEALEDVISVWESASVQNRDRPLINTIFSPENIQKFVTTWLIEKNRR